MAMFHALLYERRTGRGRLFRPCVFKLNNARHSTRPYNEGWRFHGHLIAVNARIKYAIGPGESLI